MPKRSGRIRGAMASLAVHAALLLLLYIWGFHSTHIEPMRLPGTAQGARLLLYYSPGALQHARSRVHTTAEAAKKTVPRKPAPSLRAQALPPPPPPEPGAAKTAISGLGTGDINIALLQNSPDPHPDLSSLPHGAAGDVILDAVIDQHGKIARLTLLKGLTSSIDQTVIAAVQQWTFSPATRNGAPVASEQEFSFHYERS